MYKEVVFDSQLRTGEIGFLSNIIENHDEPRGVSRYIPKADLSDKNKKALAAVYFFLRGIPFIYQGQEIGMENCAFPDIDAYDDISTLDDYRCVWMRAARRSRHLNWRTGSAVTTRVHRYSGAMISMPAFPHRNRG